MSRISAVGAFPVDAEGSSATGVSNVPGDPSCCRRPAIIGFHAVVALLASLLLLVYLQLQAIMLLLSPCSW